MANYIATSDELTAVADAIRAKGGTTDPLAFPDGFISAIDTIETGGGDAGGLPSMYTEVEYIEGHGTEFIDTGITLAQMSAARFAIMLTNKSAFSGMGVAGVNTASVPYASFSHYYAPANDKWYIPVNYFNRGNWYGQNVQENVKQEFLLEIPAGKYGCYTVDGVRSLSGSTGKSAYDDTVPVTIFALNNGTATPTEIGGFRLYYFKLFGINLDTIRDYVPCKNKLTGEVGLFDMVSKQFFGNVGSGAFTAGKEVTDGNQL